MKTVEDKAKIPTTTAEDVILNLIRHQLAEPVDILALYKSIYDCTFDEEAEKVLLKLMPKGEGKFLGIEQLLILMESLRKPKKDKETLTLPAEPHSPWTVPYPTYPNTGTPTWPSYPITSGNDGKPGPEIRYYCNQAKSPYSIENTSVAGSFDNRNHKI